MASCACEFRADFVAWITERSRAATHGVAFRACAFQDDFVAWFAERNRAATHGVAFRACAFQDDFVAWFVARLLTKRFSDRYNYFCLFGVMGS
jgi:hypothetical protein